MKIYIVDASVGAKWASPEIIEPLTEQAERFLRAYADGTIQMVVPDLFWIEIGSVLWKVARRGTIPLGLARRALQGMLNLDLPTVPSRAFLPAAFRIATDFGRTIYDSVYVAMAAKTGTDLITADERLVNALGSRFPVRWLGAF